MKRSTTIIILIFLSLIWGGFFKMAHGHKDFGQGQEADIVHSVSDMGELASRLGSPDTFQRSGNVLWFNKLDLSILPFLTNLGGTGADAYISAGNTFNHEGSLVLVGGDDAGDFSSIWKNVPFQGASRFGGEIKIRPTSVDTEVRFYLRYYNGTEFIRGTIKCDFANNKIQYMDADANYQDAFDLISLDDEVYLYHQLKYVIDVEKEAYGTLWFDDQQLDLSDVPLRNTDLVGSQHITTDIVLLGQTAANPTMQFNDWIFTINEP